MVRFTTKRIESMTLGESMKRLRSERRLTLGEISRNINVQIKHLEYLEEGMYAKLPAEVYVKGFLRNYANFMGINPDSLVKQYERERKIEKNIKKEADEKNEIEPIRFSSFIVTPKVIIIFFSILFVFSGFAYLYKQINNFVSTPRLIIMRPLDGENIQGRVVGVAGEAEKNAKVEINGQPIVVNEKGEFREDIGLGAGLNVITIIAKNKFEKETRQTISVNAEYENAPDPSSVSEEKNENDGMTQSFSLELKVVSIPTMVSVEVDGNLMYSGILSPDSVQKFEAKEKILITSENAKNTLIKFGENEEEKLGEEESVARDIVFTPNGREQNNLNL